MRLPLVRIFTYNTILATRCFATEGKREYGENPYAAPATVIGRGVAIMPLRGRIIFLPNAGETIHILPQEKTGHLEKAAANRKP